MVKTQAEKKLRIKEEFCKGCGFCINFCPDDALQFKNSFNSRGYHPVKWKGECSFCGRCYIVCPDYAIEIEDEETLEG
jgi:2-oxoglutarate ferredoxin oxidoreductase subunit delta